MKTILLFLIIWITCCPCFSQEPPTVRDALTAIGQKTYLKALEILKGDLESLAKTNPGILEDELVLHRARALFLSGDFTKAVEVCDDLLKRFPESRGRPKVNFLKAQSLAGSRKFEEALGI